MNPNNSRERDAEVGGPSAPGPERPSILQQQQTPFLPSGAIQHHSQQEVELASSARPPMEEGPPSSASAHGRFGTPAMPTSMPTTQTQTSPSAASSLDDLRTSLLNQPTMFSEDEVIGVDLLVVLRQIACTWLTPLGQMILLPYYYSISPPGEFCRWFRLTGFWLWVGAYQNFFANAACLLYYCFGGTLDRIQPAEVLIPVGLAMAARSTQALGWMIRRPTTVNGTIAMKRWLFLKLAEVLKATPEFRDAVERVHDCDLEWLLSRSEVGYSLGEVAKTASAVFMVKLWIMWAVLMAALAVPHSSKDTSMKPFNWVALAVSAGFFLFAVVSFFEARSHARQIKVPETSSGSYARVCDLVRIHVLLGYCRIGYGEGVSWLLPQEERAVYEECLRLCYLLDFPANAGFWDQLSRVRRLPDVFDRPARPASSTGTAPAAVPSKEKLMLEYVTALEQGSLTPSLFGQQIVLGFPPLANLLPAKVALVLNVVRGVLWVVLAFTWVLLPALARGDFSSAEPPEHVVEMLLELNWAFIGMPLFFQIFFHSPSNFKQLCKRLVSAHRALNTSMKGPQVAAATCLPFVDVRSHRHLLAWSEARGLLTNAASRDMAALESELGMATLSLILLGASVLGYALMHKNYTPGVLTGAAALATLSCAMELTPALFGGVILNSTLIEQVEVIRTKLYEVTMREAYEPRISAGGEDDLSRARTYASNLLVALQSDQQAFRLFGMVLDVKTLTPVASGVYTGSLYALSKVSEITGNKQV